VLRGDSHPGVRDDDLHAQLGPSTDPARTFRRRNRAGGQREAAATRHGVPGVDHDVQEGLLQLVGICKDRRQRGAELRFHADAVLGDLVLDQRQQALQQFAEVEGSELHAGRPGEVQQLLD